MSIRLERIEESLLQDRNLLHIISSFRKELTDKTVEMAAANLVEQKALANQKKFTEEHLALLRIQISGLRYQAEMALANANQIAAISPQ